MGNGAARSFTGVGFSPDYAMVLPAGTGKAVSRASGQTTSFALDADTGNAGRISSLDGDGFSVGTSADVNTSGQIYHWVAWDQRGALTDVSTYTGTGTSGLTFFTGFQPGYAIARRNDTATASAAHQRMSSQAAGDSYPFAAGGVLADSITAFNALEVAMGTNAVTNTSGATHSLIAFKSRPHPAGGGCSAPGTQTLGANADAWVEEQKANDNNGAATLLELQSRTTGKNKRAFVRFNLPAIPAGCSVALATLRLNNAAATAGRILNVQTPSAGWAENAITWGNQPGVAGTTKSAVAAAGFMEWTVTDQVRGQYTTNNGFRISDAVESGAQPGFEQRFNSREAVSDQPQLVVVYQ